MRHKFYKVSITFLEDVYVYTSLETMFNLMYINLEKLFRVILLLATAAAAAASIIIHKLAYKIEPKAI